MAFVKTRTVSWCSQRFHRQSSRLQAIKPGGKWKRYICRGTCRYCLNQLLLAVGALFGGRGEGEGEPGVGENDSVV